MAVKSKKAKRTLKKRPPAAPSPKRAEQKAETRRRVLAAAMNAFNRHGFENASTALIAREAGVSHGTVFVVASTKEQLAVAAFEDAIRAVVVDAFLTLPEGPLLTKFEHVFGKLFDYYAARPALSRALLKHLTFLDDPGAQKQYHGLVGEFLAALERRFAQPETRSRLYPDVSTLDAAQLCFSVYLFSLLLLLNNAYPDRKTHALAFRRQLLAALRGIMVLDGG